MTYFLLPAAVLRGRRLLALLLPGARRGLIGLLVLALLPGARQPTPSLPSLVLKPAPLALSTPKFYVASVVDARPDRRAVAYLLPAAPPKTTAAAPQPVDLAGGARAAVQHLLQLSVPQQAEARPVTIRLTQCLVTEKPAPGASGQVEGQVTVSMAFEWQRDGQTVHLTDYHGAARYVRPGRKLAVVEPTLRTTLTNGLLYLNTWLLAAEGRNPRLARGVRVTFTDYTLNTDPDTLFYDPHRPLTRADFLGAERPGHYAAAVFPSFAYSARPTFEHGFVHLLVETRVFVVRHSSWMSSTSNDAYVLNHEQRHFDIVKLVAERFKQKIQPARLTVEDFHATLQLAYFTSFQEMNSLQEQYDAETAGGTGNGAQERWNRRIDAELRALRIGQ